MANHWVEFVKKWAKKHRQTYMCAASKKSCQDAYHAAYPKRSTQKKHKAVTRKARMLKRKTQKELLTKFKAYAEHRKAKGIDVRGE